MKARNVTAEQMTVALAKVNKQYRGNIEFETFEANGRGVNFTLRVKDSSGPGHRLGFTGRKMAKACWHAHGHFFEALLAIAPDAEIVSRGGPGTKITRNGGNWQDSNIGSQVQPLMFSEACECNRA